MECVRMLGANVKCLFVKVFRFLYAPGTVSLQTLLDELLNHVCTPEYGPLGPSVIRI